MDTDLEYKNKDNQSIERVTECPECGSRRLSQDYDRGELICDECGLVIDETYIDQGPDWRSFDMKEEGEKARAGPPMSEMMHDKGLSTNISVSDRDSYGKSIPSKNRAQIYRLRKWQRRIRVSSAKERSLVSALKEINRIASTMGLPRNIMETSARIYKQAVEKNLIRGRSINSVVVASLYAASRKLGLPRTLDEFADATQFKRTEIGRTYRFLSRELVLQLKPTKPQLFLQRYCNELNLSGSIRKMSEDILEKAEEKELISGKGPSGLAAAAIYIASVKGGERRTQREIAEIADVTEVTVRNRYKDLVDKLNIEIDV